MFGTVFDIEGDSLTPTKLHVLSYQRFDEDEVRSLYDDEIGSIESEEILVGHNIIRFDVPVLERLYDIEIHKTAGRLLVDTLALCWYIFPERKDNKLDTWGKIFGIEKPKIDDWEGLSREEYTHRCQEDVRITKKLWEKQYKYLQRLYGSDAEIKKFLRYLMFKMYCARLQEESKWRLDEGLCRITLEKFQNIKQGKINELKQNMPPVPIVSERLPPKKLYRANGTLSELGLRWKELTSSRGLPIDHAGPIEVITGYDEPNPNSHQQLKDWLFSLGWKPRTFKENDKGVEIPQINKPKQEGGGVCESVLELAETYPELSALDGYFALSHRIGILNGFLRDVDDDGFLTASIAGLTNTLRFKHSEIVNLPKPGLPYSDEIRACLIASDADHELVGSDMSSLEDRTKQHYMYPHDPEFVLEMSKPGFDPHLDLAESDGAVTSEQIRLYKIGEDKSIGPIRGIYKGGNYSCTYGAGAPKIARTIGGTLAQGKRIWEAYWKRNWSIKKIAQSVKTKRIGGDLWLFNPVSKFWYSLRAEKDRFSTLNQGTGVFCFDVWVSRIVSKRPQLTAQFHDEIVLNTKKGYREQIKSFLQDCLEEANQLLKLNRRLDIEVQFGNNYGQIH